LRQGLDSTCRCSNWKGKKIKLYLRRSSTTNADH
jgi:hypothetical protein